MLGICKKCKKRDKVVLGLCEECGSIEDSKSDVMSDNRERLSRAEIERAIAEKRRDKKFWTG